MCGLIGRNGAGKSTTLKAIMRLIAAEGRVKVFGRDFAAEEAAVKSDIGFVGGGFGFYPLKKIKAVSKAFASFYPNWNEGTYRKYLSDFGIDEEKKPSELSRGHEGEVFPRACAVARRAAARHGRTRPAGWIRSRAKNSAISCWNSRGKTG